MRATSTPTTRFGDLVAAVYDEAEVFSTDPVEVSSLATQAVTHLVSTRRPPGSGKRRPPASVRTPVRLDDAPREAGRNVLFVYPLFPVTFWGFQHGLRLAGKKASLPPLGLLSVAALLPAEWHARLVDLNVRALLDEDLRQADIVLTGGMLIQVDSMREVISRARALGKPVAVGGPAATTSPELFAQADVVFRGEAEGRIGELLLALARVPGSRTVLDAPTGFPDMTTATVPRFDLLDMKAYASMCVQYSRGCPYRCEFCDIIEIFGRVPRVKSPAQVLAELASIHGLGYRGSVFIVDDNFIGNRAGVRQLLPILRTWQQQHETPFEFYTEASIDLASDHELLDEMVAAGFSTVFIGIETTSAEALEQARKFQNLRIDLSEAVGRITRAGLEVMGGFIVGFDSDGPDIFPQMKEFLARQPIPFAMTGMLTALPGTALWRRLAQEGRLRTRSNGDPFSRPNFQPAMDERTLLRGYADLIGWLYQPAEYYRRCETLLKRAGPRPGGRLPSLDDLESLARTIWHVGVLGPNRRPFWRLMAKAAARGPGWMRLAVSHAIQGEHLIRYAREEVLPRIARTLAELEREAFVMRPRLLSPPREPACAKQAPASPP